MAKRLLHVGCGPKRLGQTTEGFAAGGWEETRLDIDPAVEPDVVASITDMAGVPDGGFDALFTSHTIEHLYAHEVPRAFAEFRRVLKPDGFAVITCPDLQEVAREVAEGRLAETVAISPAGPISAMDMMFGWGKALAQGRHYMAHRSGFVPPYLGKMLHAAGFAQVLQRKPQGRFNIWALASVGAREEAELRALAERYMYRQPAAAPA
jgi:predicted SAM-dependent methyltransferase